MQKYSKKSRLKKFVNVYKRRRIIKISLSPRQLIRAAKNVSHRALYKSEYPRSKPLENILIQVDAIACPKLVLSKTRSLAKKTRSKPIKNWIRPGKWAIMSSLSKQIFFAKRTPKWQ